MRLSADAVLAAVEHPDELARDAALEYFTAAFSTDPRVMPAFIRAVETYPAWKPIHPDTDRLVQSDESVRWLLGRLAGHTRWGRYDGWYHTLASTLLAADVELLRAHEEAVAACPGLDPKDKAAVQDRHALVAVPPEDLWRRLEVVCRRTLDHLREYPSPEQRGTADRLARALAAHPGFAADRVLAVLRGETGDRGRWLEAYAARVARHTRLAAAVPSLVGCMLSEPDDAMFEEAQFALAAVGSDKVVERFRAAWPDAESQPRFSAVFVLEAIHSDACAATVLELAEHESDRGNKCRLYEAALRNFVPGAIEPARQLVARPDAGMEARELRLTLTATSIVMGVKFPEHDRWHEEELRARERAAKMVAEIEEDAPFPEPDSDGGGWPVPPGQLLKEGPKVGRNDPCPCGSGKKYKKCCGAKK